MVKSLDELIRKRQNFLTTIAENDAEELFTILTDLYPDTAHFIYELLQNAEDMDASTVRFILDEDRIDFEHNGTKRDFQLNDIEAITNIGANKHKKDDPTSIGKFGIGFKSVFAYTATPEIHSGDYHFKIVRQMLPVFDEVENIPTSDPEGVSWTKFTFPFNSDRKSKEAAYAESLDGLKKLDYSSILFLRNIQKIEYLLPNGELGYVERIEDASHFVKIICKAPDASTEVQTTWLRFQRPVEFTDDKGSLKQLHISVAYALEQDANTKKTRIVQVPNGGKVFIYFPTAKEHSGLRFHINAPFASTVARDSVRDCEENKKLIKLIALLIRDSIASIKSLGLLNMSFLDALPNDKDHVPLFYEPILDYVCNAFCQFEYLPAKDGSFVTAHKALQGSASISNLLSKTDIKNVAGIDKTWILNAPQRNGYADNFIHSLPVEEFTFKDFVQLFTSKNRRNTEEFLGSKTSEWLKRFYLLCADASQARVLDYTARREFVDCLKKTRFIRGSNGQMYLPTEIYILPKNTTLITKSTPIILQDFVVASASKDETVTRIKLFFQDTLEIQEYGPRIEIQRMLQQYDEGFTVDDEYFKALLEFAEYRESYGDIYFSNYALFLYQDRDDSELYIVPANELFLGKAYGNEHGELLAPIYGKYCLWDGYFSDDISHYTPKERKQFLSFVRSCGISEKLVITGSNVRANPGFKTYLASDRPYRDTRIEEDYTIPEIQKLLEQNEPKISRIIWDCLERYGNTFASTKYTTARYAPNASAPIKRCESTLIYFLKQYAWIPNKEGVLCRPGDVSVSDLAEDFAYSANNPLMVALNFGSSEVKLSQKKALLEQEAKEIGMCMIPADKYYLYERMLALEESSRNAVPRSGQDLLRMQQKREKTTIPADSYCYIGTTQTEAHIEAAFQNAKQYKPALKKLFGRPIDSSQAEKKRLKKWYHGKCQMCGTSIIGHNHEPHFVAKNVINTQHLTNSVKQTMEYAWNSMCLCPNCAAKYDVCSRDISGLYEQIMQYDPTKNTSGQVILVIQLDNQWQEVRYTLEHFRSLKKAIQLIDAEINTPTA